MTTVVGIDLSLTGTGVAVLEPERVPRLTVIGSKPIGPSVAERWSRLDQQSDRLFEFIDPGCLDDGHPLPGVGEQGLVVVEQPAYSQTQGSQHDRAGLWWLVVGTLLDAGWRLCEVSPTALKKYATGKGSASKAEMMARTAQEWPGTTFESDNDSDALWLAAMGRAYLDADTALHAVTKARQAVLKGVAWA